MRTGPEAVVAARLWRTNKDDMCLYTVQTWLDAPWSGPWAEDAWHRWGGHHAGDTDPPAGVPVYWHSPRSKYGHVALSVGGGRVRSTDWPRDTRVGETTISTITSSWRMTYLGWADRFSGGKITLGPVPARPSSRPPAHHPTTTEDDDMSTIMIKGDKHPSVWSLNETTGKRRRLDVNEWHCRNAAGEKTVTVPQIHLDALPKG